MKCKGEEFIPGMANNVKAIESMMESMIEGINLLSESEKE